MPRGIWWTLKPSPSLLADLVMPLLGTEGISPGSSLSKGMSKETPCTAALRNTEQ